MTSETSDFTSIGWGGSVLERIAAPSNVQILKEKNKVIVFIYSYEHVELALLWSIILELVFLPHFSLQYDGAQE